MHMMHIDGRIKSGRTVEFLEAWNKEILPVMKKQSGFVDETLLFEDSSDAGINLSFWNTEKEAEEYRHDIFEKANRDVEHLLEDKFTVHSCGCDAECFERLNRRKAA